MGTWNAFYVKTNDKAAVLAIRQEFPEAEIETKGEFFGVKLGERDFEAPEQQLKALSDRLGTDIIWMIFQSAVDAFQYHHWSKGDCLRSLVYGCFAEERTWERVEGSPEPWERAVFFDEKILERYVTYSESEAEQRELRRIWKEAEIMPGRTEPGLDSRSCAHEIGRYYHLPHYEY